MPHMLAEIGIAVAVVGVLALAAGLILAIASVVFAVPKDETVEKLKEALPGANCGACGYSGCEGYAAAMAHDGAPIGLCSPGGDEVAATTGAILGASGTVVKKAARVHCAGCDGVTDKTHVYRGVPSCAAANKFYGGDKSCRFGCLGYGDCAAVCAYKAISLENGIASVDATRCVGCGQCVAACPKQLLSVTEQNREAAVVRCRNRDKGGVARKACKAACIGCMKCQKVCEAGAIKVTDHLAEIDPAVCTACGKCAEVCPQGCITLS